MSRTNTYEKLFANLSPPLKPIPATAALTPPQSQSLEHNWSPKPEAQQKPRAKAWGTTWSQTAFTSTHGNLELCFTAVSLVCFGPWQGNQSTPLPLGRSARNHSKRCWALEAPHSSANLVNSAGSLKACSSASVNAKGVWPPADSHTLKRKVIFATQHLAQVRAPL